MPRATLLLTWLNMLVVLCVCQPSLAFDSALPKSARPDKNGLPAPLNLDMNYTGLIPQSVTGSDHDGAFSVNQLIPASKASSPDDNSDIHLYLQNQSGAAVPPDCTVETLEKKCFSRVYEKDTMDQRISRLEQFVFGKTFVNANLQTRLEKIAKVVNPQPISSASAQSTETANIPQQAQSLISIINNGIDHYNLHDYQHAEDDFEKCCAMAPDMARVHSYLAITKLQENERQAALQEFSTTYEIDPFGTYGRYAKLCLLKLAGDEEIRKRGPVDSDEILQSSLAKINNQSANLINFHNHESNRSTPVPANTGSFFAAQMQSTNLRNNTVLQNAYTQESANNLKHLMGLKARPGDAHLRAWGTNLNTRYYGSDTYLYAPYYIPREYPVELKAQQNTLSTQIKTKNSTKNGKRI